MKKFIRRISAAALAAVTALSLAACGKDTDGGNDAKTASEEYAYQAAGAELSDAIIGDYDSFSYYGDKIYFLSKKYPAEEGNGVDAYLNIVNTDGSGFKSVQLCSCADKADVSEPIFDPDGNGYYVYTDGTEEKTKYLLKTIDENGTETNSVDFTEAAEHFLEGLSVWHFGMDGSGNFYVTDYNNIMIFDKNGSYKGFIETDNGVDSFITDKNGDVYIYQWMGDSYKLFKLDIPEGTSEEKPQAVNIPFEGYNNHFISGNGVDTDFYVYDNVSLYSYNIGEEPQKLLDWVQAGISRIEVSDVFYAGNDTFVCAGKSFPYKYPKFSKLTKQLVNIGDRKEIILAGTEYSISSYIKNQVVKFNAVSDKYYVTIKEYKEDNISQLNLDLTSGNVPDILITNSYTPTETYIAKGIFADLYEFIDNDSELSRDDFVPNLLSSFETDGKLYRFTDCFTVYTVIGKTSIFGENMGITVDRLNEIAASMPPEAEMFAGFTKTDILTYAMEMSGSEFIDFKNGKCDFNSAGFIKILEFANGYMNDIDFDTYFDDAFWGRFETMFADESALLMVCYLTDYAGVYRYEHYQFDDPVTAVGFPCKDRIGASFVVDSGFSIAEKSSNKEGAWEFVRTMLLPEYQDCADKFPVRKDSLDKYASAAMKYDSNRINNDIVMMGGMALGISHHDSELDVPKQEDIDRMNDIIDSANGIMSYNSSVLEIITEEASSYFSGAKSAADAASLIQTRVQLYLDENA